MKTLNIFGRRIIKKTPILLAAALFMSGFFAVGLVMAAHTTDVTVEPTVVKGGATNTYNFTVTKESGDSISAIYIYHDLEFTNVSTIQCPEAWIDSYNNGLKRVTCACDLSDPDAVCSALDTVIVEFQATASSPDSDTIYDWVLKTRDTTGAYDTDGDDIVQTTVDVTAPTISSITTKDDDGDGKVETATIVFNENVDDSTFLSSMGNFKIGGVQADSINFGTTNDNTFDIGWSAGIEGTEAKVVAYTAGSGTDIVGNLMESVSQTSTDGAAPVFLSAETKTVNTIDLTFSEDLHGGTDAIADFSVDGYVIIATDELDGVITLTLESNFGTGETPDTSYVGDVADLAGLSALSAGPITPSDGVAPTLTTAVLTNSTTVELTFSENVDFFSNEDTTRGKITLKEQSPTIISIVENVATLTFDLSLGTSAIGDDSEDLEIAAEAFKDLAVSANALLQVENQNVSDGVKPTILSISSDTADGSYNEGEVIDIDVTFSENVSSTGDVTITLSTGQTCIFTVTNANSGTCNYSVQANDNSADLDVSSIAGIINDSSSNAMADFTIPFGANLADNKDIVIDTIKPLGYLISIDQGDYINNGNKTALSFTFAGAEEGAAYNYSINDTETGGATVAIVGNGTISTATDTISPINVSTLGDDTLILTVYLTDTAGNIGASVVDTTVKDVEVPTGYSVSIDQGDYINDGNKTALSFTFAGAEVDAVYNYSIDDTNEGTSAVSGDGTILTEADIISLIDVSGLDDDTLTLTVYLTDAAGNQGANTTDTVVKDALVPTVAMTYGANPTKAGDMIITATYSEMIVGTPLINIDQQGTTDIAGVEMTDSGDQIIWNYTYTVQTTNGIEYIDGTATVNLSAVADAAGNNADNPTENTFEIDTTPPSVSSYTLDGEEANVYFNPNATSTDIVLTASETVDWGFSKVQHIEDGPCAYFPEKADGSEQGIIQMTRNWDGKISDIITDGEYRMVEVKMTDGAGNIIIVDVLEPYNMIVDTENPVISNFSSPVADTVYTEGVPLTFTVADTNLGTCSYTVNDGSSFTVACSGGTIPVENLVDGRNAVALTATDLAENTVSEDSVSFVYNGDGILTVDDTPETNPDFATIQAAIDAATGGTETTDGDTISVAEGIYNENVVIDKDITLQSSGTAAGTTINALNPGDYVVNITADGATLDGFTITGYAASETGSHGAVNINAKDNCTITNNILTDNRHNAINLYSIGGEYSDYNTVSNNVINGPADQETYGIKIKGSHNTISGNKIYNADTSIHVWSYSDSETASPDYNTISGNTIAQGAGTADHKYGIEIKTGQYNEISGNTISVTRAGIHLYTSDRMAGETNFDPRPANNTISGNTITGGEVGIVLLEGANTNTISGNTITGTSIAGILGSLSRWPGDWASKTFAFTSDENYLNYLQITGNTFKDNSLDNCGHGIAMEYADNNIIGQSGHGNIIKNNTNIAAINYHGVAFTADSAAIYFDAESSDNIVNYNTITDNTNGLGNANVATTLDAKNNWWGTTDNTAISSKINGDIDYRPWCLGSTCSGDEIDQIFPTIIISTTAGDPTDASPIPVIITFSEAVSDFTVGEVIAANGTVSNLQTTDNIVYTADITPATDYQGAITIDIAAEVAWDLAGNYNTAASQFSIVYDSEAPSLTPVSIASNNTNGATLAKVGDIITLSFTSSETIQNDPVVTFASGAVAVNGTVIVTDLTSNNWTATYVMVEGDTDGAVAFTIDFVDTAGNSGTQVTGVTSGGGSVAFDKTAPILAEVTPVTTPTNDTTPDYTFSSDEVGTTSYGGSCASADISAVNGNNLVTFGELTEGTYSDCTIKVTDATGNESLSLSVSSFIIDTTSPAITSKNPIADAIGIDAATDITIDFSEKIKCSGAWSTCFTITPEGGTASIEGVINNGVENASSTLSFNPTTNLANNTEYDILLTGLTDLAGNALAEATWDFTTATSYSISLASGWNLISLPVTPTNWTSISGVLSDINSQVKSVWNYNAVAGEWYSYSNDGVDNDTISSMEAGMGYWTKMDGTGTLTGSGTLYEQLVPTGDAPSGNLPQVQLGAGWNMIGYYQLPNKTNSSPADALSVLGTPGTSWSTNHLMSFTNGTLEAEATITEMIPGKGYWIFMNEAKNYTFGI